MEESSSTIFYSVWLVSNKEKLETILALVLSILNPFRLKRFMRNTKWGLRSDEIKAEMYMLEI